MKRLVLIFVASAASLLAQAPADLITRIFTLKYADPRQVAQLLALVPKTKRMMPNYDLRSIAIEATAEGMKAVESEIAKLDVPPDGRNVELICYFVGAGSNPAQGGHAMPAELAPVAAQLQKAFAYKQYRLLEALVVRARPMERAEASSMLSGTPPTMAQLKVRIRAVGADGGIQLDQFSAGMRVPTGGDGKGGIMYNEVGVSTALDIKDGQKVVVGKSGVQGPDEALFLVLAAKVSQ
jgi:hypothetical protein